MLVALGNYSFTTNHSYKHSYKHKDNVAKNIRKNVDSTRAKNGTYLLARKVYEVILREVEDQADLVPDGRTLYRLLLHD